MVNKPSEIAILQRQIVPNIQIKSLTLDELLEEVRVTTKSLPFQLLITPIDKNRYFLHEIKPDEKLFEAQYREEENKRIENYKLTDRDKRIMKSINKDRETKELRLKKRIFKSNLIIKELIALLVENGIDLPESIQF